MEITELFETVKVKFKDLVPNAINPRKIKQAKKQQLWERLNKYGMISIPTMDHDGTLLGGHQRCEIYVQYGFGEHETDVRKAKRKLTEEEVREIMLIDNTNAGEFELQKLHSEFADYVELEEFGLDFDEITAGLHEAAEKLAGDEPEMPIVPKYSEKYSAVVIVIENSIDENFIRENLGLTKAKDYKTDNVGETYVLTAQNFIEKWQNR